MNYSSISANCSRNNSTPITDYTDICIGLYISGVVIMCVSILPFNIWALLLSRWKTAVDEGSAPSDILTLNLIFTCFIVCIAYIFYIISFNFFLFSLISLPIEIIGSMAQAQFHSWICVENCLAVVFPIFYLKLKQLRYRLVWVSFTWVTSILYGGLYFSIDYEASKLLYIIPLFVMLTVMVICSLATLTILKRHRPGGGERRKMHLLKTKAIRIIKLTLVVLIIGYYPYICVSLLEGSLSIEKLCVARAISFLLLLPGYVLHSLLYLSRFTKIPCISQI